MDLHEAIAHEERVGDPGLDRLLMLPPDDEPVDDGIHVSDVRVVDVGLVGDVDRLSVDDQPADALLPQFGEDELELLAVDGRNRRPKLDLGAVGKGQDRLEDLARGAAGRGLAGAPEGKLPVLCRGTESILSTAIVDSAVSRRVIMVTVLSGEVALQDCGNTNARDLARADMFGHSPTVVPALIAPRGVAAQNSGSHWSGSSGEVQSLLRTTMPVDSIIRHYTTQLLAAGWKTDGSLLADASAGLQRFTFREADEPWTAMLIIMAVGDRREVGLRVSRVNAAY